jgi:dynein heavy chain
LDLSLASRTPILLVGPTGTGKSLCIQEKMSGFSEEEFASLSLTFTAQTSAAQVQVIIAIKLLLLYTGFLKTELLRKGLDT